MVLSEKFVPDTLFDYNVYVDDKKLIGSGEKWKLPEFVPQEVTVAFTDILGEFTRPGPWRFAKIEQQIELTSLGGDIGHFLRQGKIEHLTICAAENTINKETFNEEVIPYRVHEYGRISELQLGKLERGKGQKVTCTMDVMYLKIAVNDKELLLIDKLNEIYRVNGIDQTGEWVKML